MNLLRRLETSLHTGHGDKRGDNNCRRSSRHPCDREAAAAHAGHPLHHDSRHVRCRTGVKELEVVLQLCSEFFVSDSHQTSPPAESTAHEPGDSSPCPMKVPSI